MLKSVAVKNYRSLADVALDGGPLLLLIGPNASGKSSVIDVLRLLSEAVRGDLDTAVSRRGGIDGVVFRGSKVQQFEIALEYFVPDPSAPHSQSDMSYELVAGARDSRIGVAAEELRVKRERGEPGKRRIWVTAKWGRGKALRDAQRGIMEPFDTKDPGILALKALGFLQTFPRIRALREFIEGWQFLSVNLHAIREPQRDERAVRLDPSARNLVNVLRTLRSAESDRFTRILENLRLLVSHVRDLLTRPEHGLLVLLFEEEPFTRPLEAAAISDGTIRLLSILTALEMMPEHGLLCIEEPEHGIHPLLFGPLLDIIREYTGREGKRQVIVTTHSPDIVDATEGDEVRVVERNDEGATRITRLAGKDLSRWLTEFRLSELWRMRQLGGVPR